MRENWTRVLVGVVVCFLSVGFLWVLRLAPVNVPGQPAPTPDVLSPEPFAGWDTPKMAIVLSGQNYGYIMPCGCSQPQYGGLARRYNFVESLKKKGWPVVAFDLGDVPGKRSSPQRKLKYEYAMKALSVIGYRAVTIGKLESDIDSLLEYTLNHQEPPVVVANFAPDSDIDQLNLTKPWKLVEGEKHPPIAVMGMIGADTQQRINNPLFQFFDKGERPNATIIRQTLMSMGRKTAGKAPVTILLYQGDFTGAKACAQFCAQERLRNPKFPRLDVILCNSDKHTAEPPETPLRVEGTPTQIIRAGHKGKYVGVLGVFAHPRKARHYTFRYQLALLSPKYQPTKEDVVRNKVVDVFSEYAKIVKERNLIVKWPSSRHSTQVALEPKLKPSFVGSKRCRGCHRPAYKIWKDSAHYHAFDTLVDLNDKPHEYPPHREHDAECVKCHVVGFEHTTGYRDMLTAGEKMKFRLEALKGVGCESCHGPCSMHVEDPQNKAFHPLINPWKAQPGMSPEAERKRKLKIDVFCQNCHDQENDVNWKFEKRWPKIIHMTPKDE
ncbi:MAG: multiheme c-type cytochrome [Gemmataceae bacterium]